MKFLFSFTILLIFCSCAATTTTNISNKSATVSCFSNGKLVLRMKSKGNITRISKPLLKFKDERGFDVEVDNICVTVYTDEKLYERFN